MVLGERRDQLLRGTSLQVTALGQESNQLQEAHPDSADEIAAKQDEIVTAWGNLKDKVWYI